MSVRFEGVGLPLAEFELRLDTTFPARATLVVGPSGAGKSTLLEMVAGLRRPRRGWIEILGELVDDAASGKHVPPPRRGVGWVPQEGALFPHLSVRRNLFYGSRGGAAPRTETILELLELRGLLERSARALSGGEQRRVAIGRALLSGARVLLLDEPFAGLDSARRQRIADCLLRVRDELSIPALCVSHDWTGLGEWAEEIVVLERGAIVDRGPVAKLLEPDPEALRLRGRSDD